MKKGTDGEAFRYTNRIGETREIKAAVCRLVVLVVHVFARLSQVVALLATEAPPEPHHSTRRALLITVTNFFTTTSGDSPIAQRLARMLFEALHDNPLNVNRPPPRAPRQRKKG